MGWLFKSREDMRTANSDAAAAGYREAAAAQKRGDRRAMRDAAAAARRCDKIAEDVDAGKYDDVIRDRQRACPDCGSYSCGTGRLGRGGCGR